MALEISAKLLTIDGPIGIYMEENDLIIYLKITIVYVKSTKITKKIFLITRSGKKYYSEGFGGNHPGYESTGDKNCICERTS